MRGKYLVIVFKANGTVLKHIHVSLSYTMEGKSCHVVALLLYVAFFITLRMCSLGFCICFGCVSSLSARFVWYSFM